MSIGPHLTQRPLSPHLRIYRPTMTMTMSIAHRFTGAALYVGTVMLAWWLLALASGPAFYARVQVLLASWPGQLLLFAYLWALLHHLFGGLRHLLWDLGIGIDLPAANRLAWGTLAGSTVLAVLVWFIGRYIGAAGS